MIGHANSQVRAILAEDLPEVLAAGDQVDTGRLGLEDLNRYLHRRGFEAWSRFPGLSVRFRKRVLRVRGGREAFQWQKDPERMARKRLVFPARDELYSKPVKDKYAEIGARLSQADRHAISLYFDNQSALFRLSSTAAHRAFWEGLGKLVEYVATKRWLASLTARSPYMDLEFLKPAQCTDRRGALADAGASYIRERLRETSFARKILPPDFIGGLMP